MRFVLILLAMLSGTLARAENPILQIATGDYAPFTDQNAPDGGMVNAYVENVANAAGYDVEFTFMPWIRSLELTRTGRYAASSYWFFREEREEDFIQVGPVVTDRLVLFRRVDTQLPAWGRIQDLGEVTLGAVTGYTYTPDFWDLSEAGELTVQTAQSDEANLRKLFAGRIDAYPMSEEVGLNLLQQIFTDEERSLITTEPEPLVTTHGYLLFSRQLDNAVEVANQFQQVIDEVGPATRVSGS